jgi:hypothetical protein
MDADTMQEKTCQSAFVVPGDPPSAVRRCEGRPNHVGVFHGGDGVAWGPNAALDNRPAEPLLIKTSQLLGLIRQQYVEMADAAARFRELIDLHRLRDGKCRQCGTYTLCPTAVVLGIEGVDEATLDAIVAGEPAQRPGEERS